MHLRLRVLARRVSTSRQLLIHLGIALFLWPGLVASQVARAEAPSGVYEYEFNSSDHPPLWDFSGAYLPPLWMTLVQGARGKITGGASGKVSGGPRGVRVSLRESVDGWGEGNGLSGVLVKRSCRYLLTLDPAARLLSGIEACVHRRIRVTVLTRRSLGTTRTRGPISVSLPVAVKPEWRLTLNVVPEGTSLSGSARIILASRKVIEFALRGRYSEESGQSRIVLRGLGEWRGERLSLYAEAPDMALSRMRGKVAGQTIDWPDASM